VGVLLQDAALNALVRGSPLMKAVCDAFLDSATSHLINGRSSDGAAQPGSSDGAWLRR
jgi:hypothetical protein